MEIEIVDDVDYWRLRHICPMDIPSESPLDRPVRDLYYSSKICEPTSIACKSNCDCMTIKACSAYYGECVECMTGEAEQLTEYLDDHQD